MEHSPGIPHTGSAKEQAAGQLCQHSAMPVLALSRAEEIISLGKLPHFQCLRTLTGSMASYADTLASQSVSPCAALPTLKTWQVAVWILQQGNALATLCCLWGLLAALLRCGNTFQGKQKNFNNSHLPTFPRAGACRASKDAVYPVHPRDFFPFPGSTYPLSIAIKHRSCCMRGTQAQRN